MGKKEKGARHEFQKVEDFFPPSPQEIQQYL
jgi:hypothetical protein